MTAPVLIVRPDDPEWLARKRLIDPKLAAAGWRVVPYSAARPLAGCDRLAIMEYPTANGPADYALCVGGRLLGIAEAKKLSVGPGGRLTQAERYSRGAVESALEYRGYRVPFLYATNGQDIWHHDVRHPLECARQVKGFHTPDALVERMARDAEAVLAVLADLPNADRYVRPYQREANAAIEAGITARKRKMLVAMATGTGKTFTTVNQVYRLMKSGVARRVLFLVDRRALAAQAVRAFASFDAEPGYKFNQVYPVYSQRIGRRATTRRAASIRPPCHWSTCVSPDPARRSSTCAPCSGWRSTCSGATPWWAGRTRRSAARRSTRMPSARTSRSTRST